MLRYLPTIRVLFPRALGSSLQARGRVLPIVLGRLTGLRVKNCLKYFRLRNGGKRDSG